MSKQKNNKQLVTKTKTTSYLSLPYQLVEDIKSLNLSKTNTNYCYKFVGIIIRNNWLNDESIFEYTEIPTAYIKKSFNAIHYTQWLFPLLELGIIERDNTYLFGDSSKSYFYKLNSRYNTKYCLVLIDTITSNPLCTVAYEDIMKLNFNDNQYLKWFKNDMDTLTIDYDKLNELMEEEVCKITIDKFAINEEILDRNIMLKDNGGRYFSIPREEAIKRATKKGLVLLKDKNKFKMVNPESFINDKINSIRICYSEAILNLEHVNLRVSRNDTNNRLDTNITNMCSILTDEICKQNGLTQIDLKNSQFTLLSHILTANLDTDDFKLFKSLSISGGLYDYIKQELGLETRKQGKIGMFEILFSSRKNNTTNKAKLKTIFPSVIKWIDDFKAANGDSQFSIMLQKYESQIFIDNILTKIKKKGLFCLTKHDSVIIRDEDFDTINEIITNEFKNIGLEYTLDVKRSYLSNDIQEEIVEDHSNKIFKEMEEKYKINRQYFDYIELVKLNQDYTNISKLSFTDIIKQFRSYKIDLRQTIIEANKLIYG
jgi:hypothetical protein